MACATSGGAFLTFQETEKGVLDVGMLADIVVLSDNPLTCDAVRLPEIVADLTLVGGKVVFQRGKSISLG